MANRPYSIELPEDLLNDLDKAGLLQDSAFVSAALMEALAQHQAQKRYTQAEMLAAVEETYGICADADWTMDDILALKRKELSWEEFVDKTAGILADDPIQRGSQGEYDNRDICGG